MSADNEETEDCPLCGEPNEKGFACRYVRRWRETGELPDFYRRKNHGQGEKEEAPPTSGSRLGSQSAEGTSGSDAETQGSEETRQIKAPRVRQHLERQMYTLFMK